jgi:hypothetical protein
MSKSDELADFKNQILNGDVFDGSNRLTEILKELSGQHFEEPKKDFDGSKLMVFKMNELTNFKNRILNGDVFDRSNRWSDPDMDGCMKILKEPKKDWD